MCSLPWTSGLTVAAFAREHDLDAQRIYAWRRRLATEATASRSSSSPIRFVELPRRSRCATRDDAAHPDQIHFPGGVALYIEGAVDDPRSGGAPHAAHRGQGVA